jgi:hypothetical protein
MAKRANTKDEAPFAAALDRYFGLAQQGTDVRTEFIAGVTTFLTMVYIIFVNPIILGKAGMDQGAVFVATCVAAAVSTMVMALYANYPIALAPGMGINAFFAFTGGTYLQVHVAAGTRRRVLFGRAVLPDLRIPHPAIRHRLDPAKPQARSIGGRRPVSRNHCTRGSQGCC